MRLFFIFPVSGPNNGVKIISNHIKNALFLQKDISIQVIDTAQAKDYNNFGKFSFNKVSGFLKLLKDLFKIKNTDAVYLNITPKGYAFYRDMIILKLCKFRTSNITVHIHANGLEKRIRAYNKLLLKEIKLIVINECQNNILKEYFNEVFLVPNSLPDYFENKLAINSPQGKINLIFLSNISKEKGVKRIERIAEIIAEYNLNCHINVHGGALTEKEKTTMDALDRKYDFITYHGPTIMETDKFKQLSANDILLFLSDENYEVYPLVYIEALMSGLPIITTKQVVTQDLINFEVSDVLNENLDNFRSIIEIYSQDLEKLKMLKQKARHTYLEKYSFMEYIKIIENIILHDSRGRY